MFHLRVISKAAITPSVTHGNRLESREVGTVPATKTQPLARGRLLQVEHPEPTEALSKRRPAADLETSGEVHTRTCARCGRRARFRMEQGGWARCSKCGRYA